MSSQKQRDSWWIWYGKLALYRVWRLRRAILLIALLPFAGFYAGTVFHPKLGPIFFPDLSLTNPLPEFDGTRFFIFGLASVAVVAAIFSPLFMARGVTVFFLASLVILLMPWGWEFIELIYDHGVSGVSYMVLTAGTLWAASAIWKSKWLQSVCIPGVFTVRARIPVNGSSREILDSLKYAPGYADWNEMIKEVQDHPEIPGRRVIRYVTGDEVWTDIRPGRDDWEFIEECRQPHRPGYLSIAHYRLHKGSRPAMLEMVERVKGMALLDAIYHLVHDGATDQLVYFRDRMEGRRSLSNKATFLRALKRQRRA